MLSCLEAARWAASSFNEQPWTFLAGVRGNGDAFDRLVGCLLEVNQAWAKRAGVIILTVVCRTLTRDRKPNRVEEHDIGLAVGNLTVQATALGLAVHEMAGIDLRKAGVTCGIPQSHEAYTALAVGYAVSIRCRRSTGRA